MKIYWNCTKLSRRHGPTRFCANQARQWSPLDTSVLYMSHRFKDTWIGVLKPMRGIAAELEAKTKTIPARQGVLTRKTPNRSAPTRGKIHCGLHLQLMCLQPQILMKASGKPTSRRSPTPAVLFYVMVDSKNNFLFHISTVRQDLCRRFKDYVVRAIKSFLPAVLGGQRSFPRRTEAIKSE